MSQNLKPTFILIDGSYFCFYRYYSVMNWWRNAFPEQLDVIQNPYQNEVFLEKFKKTFVDTVKQIPKKLNINKSVKPIMMVGKDCKRADIWRTQLFPQYKGTRDNSPDFMGGAFFKMAYDAELFIQGGATTVLKHDTLEADDCIAIYVKELLKVYPQCQIYIITSDKDYLQLAEHRVQIYNMAFKNLTEQKSSNNNAECDLFCKIVMGDQSDNIPSVFPKCGPKTALKYFNDRDLFLKRLQENENYQKQYELNTTLVDFNSIPKHLITSFLQINKII
jgi:5'-3' exonuclease